MLYREVIESDNIPSQYDQYLFIGFNVLQKVEQKLFASLQKERKAQFYWDYDNYYFKGFNEAGVYIKRWLKIFPNSLENRANPLYECFEKEKDIQFISAPTENLQARYITEWLRENNRYKDGKRTAIVMCDENLLKTVIHCVPPEVDSINVTTGFPLQQAPISSMISQLITLQTDGYSVRKMPLNCIMSTESCDIPMVSTSLMKLRNCSKNSMKQNNSISRQATTPFSDISHTINPT